MDGTANHFLANMHQIAVFCRYNLNSFSGGDTSGPLQKRPGAWTQTPISAWLASVPIVLVLRNGLCCLPASF